MESLKHNKLLSCFQDWMNQEHEDLQELLQTLARSPDNGDLCLLAEKGIKHFEEYLGTRALLAQHDAPSLLSPSWCTSFENAFLWIGGYRPSLSIRLVFSLSGSKLEEFQPAKSIEWESKNKPADESQAVKSTEAEKKPNLGELSAEQLNSINKLYRKAVEEEEKLSSRMASFQENIGDDPLARVGENWSPFGELSEVVNQVLNGHSLALANVLVDADKLRLSILKELISILTPLQSVDLLVAVKKLHISMHEWGKISNQQKAKIPELQSFSRVRGSKTSTGIDV